MNIVGNIWDDVSPKVQLFLDEEEEHLSVEAWPVPAVISPFRGIKSALFDSVIYAD